MRSLPDFAIRRLHVSMLSLMTGHVPQQASVGSNAAITASLRSLCCWDRAFAVRMASTSQVPCDLMVHVCRRATMRVVHRLPQTCANL